MDGINEIISEPPLGTEAVKASQIAMMRDAIEYAELAKKHAVAMCDLFRNYPEVKGIVGAQWLDRGPKLTRETRILCIETQRFLRHVQSIATLVYIAP